MTNRMRLTAGKLNRTWPRSILVMVAWLKQKLVNFGGGGTGFWVFGGW